MLLHAFAFSLCFGKLLRVAVGLKLSVPTTVKVGVFLFNLMEKDSFKGPFMVGCVRYMILTFSRLCLDATRTLTLRYQAAEDNVQ